MGQARSPVASRLCWEGSEPHFLSTSQQQLTRAGQLALDLSWLLDPCDAFPEKGKDTARPSEFCGLGASLNPEP